MKFISSRDMKDNDDVKQYLLTKKVQYVKMIKG